MYDCCGDGRAVGDSLATALRNALRLVHENLHGFLLVSSERCPWMLAIFSMLLAVGLFGIVRCYVITKVTRPKK
jgi:hypothetical protein